MIDTNTPNTQKFINIKDISSKKISIKHITNPNENDELNKVIFSNVCLLENLTYEKSFIDNKFTMIKIICTKDIKIFLKMLEKDLNKDISLNNNKIKIHINYDYITQKDYYDMYISKIIKELVSCINTKHKYNIIASYDIISYNNKLKLIWDIHSIEINDDDILIQKGEDIIDDEDVFDDYGYIDEPDYEAIRETFLLSLNKEIKKKTEFMNKENKKIKKMIKLRDDIMFNFKIDNIEYYDENIKNFS
jgi:Ni,Fe-hydrogenase I large subunit